MPFVLKRQIWIRRISIEINQKWTHVLLITLFITFACQTSHIGKFQIIEKQDILLLFYLVIFKPYEIYQTNPYESFLIKVPDTNIKPFHSGNFIYALHYITFL